MSEVGTHQPAIEQIDALFQRRIAQVPVLRQRAGAEGVHEIRFLEDLVPLLFPHTRAIRHRWSTTAAGPSSTAG